MNPRLWKSWSAALKLSVGKGGKNVDRTSLSYLLGDSDLSHDHKYNQLAIYYYYSSSSCSGCLSTSCSAAVS